MQSLSSTYFINQPLHVSSLFIVESVVLIRLEPNQDNRQSTKKKNKIQLCIYKVYLLMMVYKYAQNMQRMTDEKYRG